MSKIGAFLKVFSMLTPEKLHDFAALSCATPGSQQEKTCGPELAFSADIRKLMQVCSSIFMQRQVRMMLRVPDLLCDDASWAELLILSAFHSKEGTAQRGPPCHLEAGRPSTWSNLSRAGRRRDTQPNPKGQTA